jgi:hypothetical protein
LSAKNVQSGSPQFEVPSRLLYASKELPVGKIRKFWLGLRTKKLRKKRFLHRLIITMTPALFMRTSSRFSSCRKLQKVKNLVRENFHIVSLNPFHLFENSLIESNDDKSNFLKKTLLFPLFRMISERATSPRSIDLHAM